MSTQELNTTDAAFRSRRQRAEDRELSIVATAHTLFNQRGYAATTISDIARESGVADGTVYTYFKNKDDLARAVLVRFYDNLTHNAQTGVDKLTTIDERLGYLARHHLENVLSEWRILEILPFIGRTTEAYEGSQLHTLNRAYVAIFDRVIQDAKAQKRVPQDTPIWMIRDMFFGSMDYAARTLLLRNETQDVEAFIATLLSMILDQKSKPEQKSEISDVVTRLEQVAARLESL